MIEKNRTIYLDYNATTPLLGEVEAAMRPFWRECYANASSRHQAGQAAWLEVEKSRHSVAKLAQASADDVIFTSGATESNYLALLGRFQYLISEGLNPNAIRVAVSAIEHPCVLACAEELIKRGAQVEFVPVGRDGKVEVSFFDAESKWDIVSIMAANHETGAIQPLHEISQKLDSKLTFFHTDAAQWAGRYPGGLSDWGVDAISMSAHKLYGPKGVGCLINRRSKTIEPLFHGSQEGGMRGGTLNVPGIAGFGAAVQWVELNRDHENQHLEGLKAKLWKILSSQTVKHIKKTISSNDSLVNTLHIRIPGMKGERVVDALDQQGICCSTGPACASGASDVSPVLKAMGLEDKEALEGIRISVGHGLSESDIQEAGERIIDWLQEKMKHVA